MTGRKYWVDWSDPPYPRIRPLPEDAPSYMEPLSLTAARQEIIKSARYHRAHWLEVIKRTKALTTEEIEADESFFSKGVEED